ncbi:S9 family peptidase [Ferdinandcohnia quinoae]|uniref:S9 family peptidase n=1 Tax=Fredinandcohnia quinoae TaxID=2918902 RepID=A0AAW5E9Z3_9BACI|nr:S9 family peptidase [Fredinandcohnia sp. SECRCQ15]MCH1626856.1 S9 family peptidase [Fredinandcohnia sp. SECRCQ15]
MKRRAIIAEDLYELKSVNDPQLSPNGEKFVFVETDIQKEKHEYSTHLYVGHLDGEINQWTFGNVKDSSPRWSPDGETIAFVSNRSEKPQIFLMSIYGGEPRQLTHCKNGARNPIWSPEGNQILFTTSLGPDEEITDKEEKKKEDKKLEPMVVEGIRYKSDAAGFLDNKHQQLGLVNVKTGDVEQLTSGNHDYTAGTWSPDGKCITIIGDFSEDSDYNLISDVFIFSLVSKTFQKITTSDGIFANPTWSPDGKYIALIGHKKEFMGATLSKIWLYHLQSNELLCLTDDWDVQLGDAVVGDFISGSVDPGLIWNSDSRSFYFLISDRGSTGVYYGSIDGEMYPSLMENQHVYALSVDGKNHKAVIGISKPTHPGDLYYLDLSTGELRQLTNVNEKLLEDVHLSEAEPFTFKASDGWDIHGWVMKPYGFEVGKKYPTIIEVHGGPHAMYANTYFHEFQVLTGKGFVVVFTNPRGSHGYGQVFVDAVRGDYGGKDYLDVMAATDYAVTNFDYVDESRLGVTGGSYGGFMTNWIVGHTNRFKAAVTQRSISNWLSFYGVSDIGYYFTEWEIKGNLLNDAEKLWNHSPLKYVSNVETPLLLLHGEKDFRCPIEQAEQFYIALKHQKKKAKFVRFPGANHELSRSGNPKLRLSRLNHIKDWFVQHLN